MLVEVGAVEVDEPVRVVGKVARHPVDQHAEAFAMADVDEVFQVVGLAVTAGRGEQADRLIAPGAVERILVDRHELDVGEAQILDVRHQIVGEFAIRKVAVALLRLALP